MGKVVSSIIKDVIEDYSRSRGQGQHILANLNMFAVKKKKKGGNKLSYFERIIRLFKIFYFVS